MEFLRHRRCVRLRRNVLDSVCVLVSRIGGLVEKDDFTGAVWRDTVPEENHLAHLHRSNGSTLPGLEVLARRDDPAQSFLTGDAACLTDDTERAGAGVQTSQS